ncbi:ABC transporter permease [Paenibacillus albidus]|uniref:ABC transporter permease n=1 Tax=Paenibacillus albidus TaxID=2041023 RepID=A0A917FKC4_9BACL|nr:carbohydrate ABC transporter permease [Paenibacillus albidus]GGF90291.1 ABC transporter permease [Paenibacillus albidus]
MSSTTAKIQTTKVRKRVNTDRLMLSIIGYVTLTVLAIFCIVPFLLVVSASLSEESSIIEKGFQLIPSTFSTEAYSLLFKYPADMLRAYGVTISVTLIGTVLGLFLTSMTAYVLSRSDFKWRSRFSFYFFFTTLFSGGLVPSYLLIINFLHLKDTLMVLILPMLMNVFYIIVMKSFMSSIPDAITESAKIDGAGDFRIFLQLIVPLSKPALATIGLFIALGYWNDWYNALLYISKSELMPLQYYLYKMLGNMDGMRKAMMASGVVVNSNLPTESLKMAMTIVATGPILLAYPFIQKYFVQGLTIGAVKG